MARHQMRLDDLPKDEQIKYKTELYDIDRILSAYEKGKISKLATDKRYSINLILFVLGCQRGVLKQTLEDINRVMNGLLEYADVREWESK